MLLTTLPGPFILRDEMKRGPSSTDRETLRVIPFYTGDATLEEALRNPKSLPLLWLEILLNEEVCWEDYLDRKEVRAAHEKASNWYGRFRTMIEGHIGRRSLQPGAGEIDDREYRKFQEALNFVSRRT